MERRLTQASFEAPGSNHGFANTTAGPFNINRTEMMPPGLRNEIMPTNRQTTSSTSEFRHFMNKPTTFDGKKDVRLWLLEIDDYLHDYRADSQQECARIAIGFLRGSPKDTIGLARLRGDPNDERFTSWTRLKEWLLEQYCPQDNSVEADLRMDVKNYRRGDTIQEFTNRFENILQDVAWNTSDIAVMTAYRKKLPTSIIRRIHDSTSGLSILTYSQLKRAAHDAEKHLKFAETLSKHKPWENHGIGNGPQQFAETNNASLPRGNTNGRGRGGNNYRGNRTTRTTDERWESTKKAFHWVQENVLLDRKLKKACMACGSPTHWANETICPEHHRKPSQMAKNDQRPRN